MELFTAICLGLGLSACCGFRVFVPVLAANIASLAGLYQFGAGFEWLGTWLSFGILLTATLAEITAYYIPVVDNFLDTIATPLAIGAGTLLTTSFLSEDMQPFLKWGLGLMVGGGTAGIVQAGTGLLRLGSTSTTGGLANPAVSTAENGLSAGFSILAILIPPLVAALALFTVFYISRKLIRYFRRKNKDV